jgi:hypothetical protein
MANAFNMNLGAQSAPKPNNPSMSTLLTISAYHDEQRLLRFSAMERIVRFNQSLTKGNLHLREEGRNGNPNV